MSCIAIIPARGGSVRISRKNIRPFAGKPMLQWPVDAAQASGLFDSVLVSSDDDEILGLAASLGCVIHRRPLDDGATGTQEVAARVLDQHRSVDEACVIYPCTPMLTAQDLRSHRRQWLLSGQPLTRSVIQGADAGAVYWGHACAFRQRLVLEANCADIEVDPARFIDINTPEDWAKAEAMFDALRRANV